MKLLDELIGHSVTGLVRLACVLALLGLAIMSFSILSGKPLPVVLAMSFGHVVGMASFACFFLAVLIDAIRSDNSVKRESTPTGAPSEPMD